ncbi:MAG: hypothetical protein JOY70_07450 [Acidisphaera sp.]|nr:hypothetical protein [Acidisphaera sp.]
MRKLLLASAALLGGSAAMAGSAFAQATPAPTPTTVPTPSFFTVLPSPTPGPGTITVRLNVRIAVNAGLSSDSGQNAQTVTTGATPTGVTLASPNSKLSKFSIYEYGRFFPGFDGIAANGLKYGAAAELRQDQGVPPGGGANGSISGVDRSANTIYWRREYVYFGTDQLGFIRAGMTDGPVSLYTTGTFENFDTGGWNGDAPGFVTGGAGLVWPFADVGQTYTPSKIVYLSPQFAGFDFGGAFAPGTNNGPGGLGNCPYNTTAANGVVGPLTQGNATGCYTTQSTSVLGETARPRNITELGARYRASFGPVGLAATVQWYHTGKVADNATPQPLLQYDEESQGIGGFQLTYGGFAIGGAVQGGAANIAGGGGFALKARGAPDEFDWVAGTSYAFGPFIVGASYYRALSAGSKTSVAAGQSPFVGMRRESGVAAGGTYNFAPGMNVFLDYIYGTRHESGVDLLSGTTSSGTTPAGFVYTNNNTRAQVLMLGTAFRW